MPNPKLPPILINKAGSVYYVYTYKTSGTENSNEVREVNPKRSEQSLAARRKEKFVLMKLSFRNILNFVTIRLRERVKIMSLHRSQRKVLPSSKLVI